eukprot:g72171.t1
MLGLDPQALPKALVQETVTARFHGFWMKAAAGIENIEEVPAVLHQDAPAEVVMRDDEPYPAEDPEAPAPEVNRMLPPPVPRGRKPRGAKKAEAKCFHAYWLYQRQWWENPPFAYWCNPLSATEHSDCSSTDSTTETSVDSFPCTFRKRCSSIYFMNGNASTANINKILLHTLRMHQYTTVEAFLSRLKALVKIEGILLAFFVARKRQETGQKFMNERYVERVLQRFQTTLASMVFLVWPVQAKHRKIREF